MSKFVGTGALSYGKRIYWVAVSQRLRNTALETSTVRQRSPKSGCSAMGKMGSPTGVMYFLSSLLEFFAVKLEFIIGTFAFVQQDNENTFAAEYVKQIWIGISPSTQAGM
jgi:hypothetical protein